MSVVIGPIYLTREQVMGIYVKSVGQDISRSPDGTNLALFDDLLDKMKSDGYCFQIETTFKIWKKGLRVKEIPIVFTDRTRGTSKMSGGIISEAFFLVLKLRLGLA